MSLMGSLLLGRVGRAGAGTPRGVPPDEVEHDELGVLRVQVQRPFGTARKASRRLLHRATIRSSYFLQRAVHKGLLDGSAQRSLPWRRNGPTPRLGQTNLWGKK